MRRVLTTIGLTVLAYGTYRAFMRKERRYIRLN